MDGGAITEREFTAVFLFAGIGVGALGFLDAQITLNGCKGRVRSLGGVDLDPVACRSFTKLTKSPCYALDIGKMTGADLRRLFGPKAPHQMWAAGEELVVDRREALKAGMRALLDGGVEGLNAFVGRSANRLTAGAHYALQVMVGELHPEVERTALDNYDFGEH